ncbi:MAG: gliding motility-associated C-terminal domain-containing protein [Bacteroidota bacterium]
MKKIFFIAIIVLTNTFSYAQNEANNWYFGNKAGITFNSGSPVALTGSQMNAWEGVATISDPSGMMLFYTDGIKVWNRNHAQMTNGSGLKGDPSSAQSGVIVPKPGNPNLYYIFSVPYQGGSVITPARLYYSLVNMNLSGGLGDVVTTEKNVNISPSNRVQEKITAVLHCNGKDIWVIAHEYGTNKFLVYLVTATSTPTLISTQAIGETWAGDANGSIGILKASSDGKRIAESANSNEKAQVLNFDNSTGQLSNPTTLTNLKWCYGVEFSPNNSFLYISTWYNLTPQKIISQYNLNAANINSSRFDITTAANVGSLQRGPDGKIYVARDTDDGGGATEGKQHLGVISNPNNLGASCNYIEQAVNLGGNEATPANGGLSRYGLPNFIQSYFEEPNNWSYTDTCLGNPTQFTADIQSQHDSVRWNFAGLGSSTSENSSFVFPNPGNYTINFYIFKRCDIDTITKTINIKNGPLASISGPLSICPNSTASYQVPNNSNYTYTWSINGSGTINGSTNTNQISVLWGTSGSGTISVSITDSQGGCSSDSTITVVIANNLSISITPNAPSICNGSQVALTASGATQYSWTPNTGLTGTGSNVLASPSTTTIYTVNGTDASGCSGSANVTVTVNNNPTIQVNPASSTICLNSTVSLTASGASTYTWSPSTSLSSGTGSTVISTPIANTSYTIIGTDANGCTAQTTANVTIAQNVTLNITPSSPTICQGSSTNLTVSGADTYNWSPSAGLNQTTGTTVVASPLQTTTYYVVGTNGNGCSGNGQVVVTVGTSLNILVTPNNQTICNGNSVNLTASGANNYSWTPSTGLSAISGASVTATPSDTTIYTVSGTDNTGCTGTTEVIINVNPIPSVSIISPDQSICSGSNIPITAQGATSYSWSPSTYLNQTSGSTVSANPSLNIVYTVTGTLNGCSASDNISINVGNIHAPSLSGATTICNFSNGIPYTINGLLANSTYTWTSTNGTIISNTGTNIEVNWGAQGVGTLNLHITDTVYNCQLDTSYNFTIISSYHPQIIPQTDTVHICPTALVQLGTDTIYPSYQWLPSGTTNPEYFNTDTGWIKVIVGTGTCQGADSIFVIRVYPKVIANPSDTLICKNSEIQLSASGVASYLWTPSAGLSSATISNPKATLTATTRYIIKGTDIYGCSAFDTVLISVNPFNPILYASADTICRGNSVSFLISDGETFKWTPDSLLSNDTIKNPIGTPLNSAEFSCLVSDSIGCVERLSHIVKVIEPETFDLGPDLSICDTQLPYFIEGPSGYSQYFWTNGSTEQITEIKETQSLILNIETNCGIISDSINVEVKNCKLTVYMPNTFTPDNDNLNDIYEIEGMNIKSFNARIFNRWGELIYEWNETIQGWDGKYKGEKVQAGVYVLVLELVSESGLKFNKAQSVNVMY